MIFFLAFWLLVSLMLAVLIGSDIERGNDTEAAFAILFCVFWPVAIALVLSSLIATKWRRAA